MDNLNMKSEMINGLINLLKAVIFATIDPFIGGMVGANNLPCYILIFLFLWCGFEAILCINRFSPVTILSLVGIAVILFLSATAVMGINVVCTHIIIVFFLACLFHSKRTIDTVRMSIEYPDSDVKVRHF